MGRKRPFSSAVVVDSDELVASDVVDGKKEEAAVEELTFINNSDINMGGKSEASEREGDENGEVNERESSIGPALGAESRQDDRLEDVFTSPGRLSKLNGASEKYTLKRVTQSPVPPAPASVSASAPKLPLTSTEAPVLNFSQQQASIQLQSPSKRREATPVPEGNEPRLVIDKLVLNNFKSYAGKQVIGPFHSSFSAVVGPNGSGKSNVIDSLLFVFGFRALKMRQGRVSELIHNSAGGDKLDFCQVDIHFHHVLDSPDNSKATVIEGSDLVISRKAFKNNSSQYFINNKNSHYTEVTKYLRDKGIDLDHKRFLILQGEVESIAQMKAKAERENDDGLLEYLEDIIGTAKYKKLIEEGLTQVIELNDVCAEKENRLELVEKDKDLLEEKMKEALKFLELEKKLINKKSIQFQTSITRHEGILKENEGILQGINEEIEKEKAANKELGESILQYTKEVKTVEESIFKLDKEIGSVTKAQKKASKDNVTIEEKMKNLTSKSKKVSKTLELLKGMLTTAERNLESIQKNNLLYNQEVEALTLELESEKRKLDEIRSSITDKTSVFTKQIGSLKTSLEPWSDKLKSKETEIKLIDSSIEMLRNQENNVSRQLDEARQRLFNIKSEGKQKEEKLSESEEKLTHVNEQCTIGEEKCKADAIKLKEKRNHLLSVRQKTHETINSLNNFQNKNKVLSSLMKLANSGRISGFYGRLGDLGAIDDKYDIAVSTACPGLDSMVVESVETAQICIDYLRKNKLGYANFICLDKLRKFNLSQIQTPGNPATVKRIFDLIHFDDPKFAPAFYSKLYNTLVASTLQEAKSVAYGAMRWKVVTLDGKVVDTSGTMSGGGNYVAKGSMRLLSDKSSGNVLNIEPNDVNKMKAELANLEKEYETFNHEVLEKETKLRKLKDLGPELDHEISRLKLDIESLAAEKKEVLALCKKLISQNENDGAKQQIIDNIKEKEQEKQALVTESEELRSQTKELEEQIAELEEKVMDAGGVELKVQNAKVDSIKQKIEILNEKFSQDRINVTKFKNDVKRYTKVVGESTRELEEIETELKFISSRKSSIISEIEKLQARIEELQTEKEEKDEKLKVVNEELAKRNEEINKYKSNLVELENKTEKYNAIIKNANKRILDDEESLEGLVIPDVSPYISWLSEEEQARYNGSEIEKLSEESLEKLDIQEVEKEIEELERYMSTVKVDIEVLTEYGAKKSEFDKRKKDLNSAVEERDEVKNNCEELKRRRLDEFMEGFNTISMSLKEMYQMITMGGNAELELVDSLDPFSEGILFSVMPPKKSWKNISNLSGGEKTLSSLALVFALHKYKPTPLYVMDEIDAALDFRNVSIVANYIKERTKNAQFIVISLRNNMFELAQQLIGIYKVNHMTRSVSLQNKDFVNPEK